MHRLLLVFKTQQSLTLEALHKEMYKEILLPLSLDFEALEDARF